MLYDMSYYSWDNVITESFYVIYMFNQILK